MYKHVLNEAIEKKAVIASPSTASPALANRSVWTRRGRSAPSPFHLTSQGRPIPKLHMTETQQWSTHHLGSALANINLKAAAADLSDFLILFDKWQLQDLLFLCCPSLSATSRGLWISQSWSKQIIVSPTSSAYINAQHTLMGKKLIRRA